MNERRRPPRRGRGPRPTARPAAETGEPNPYREGPPEGGDDSREPAPRATEVSAPVSTGPTFEPPAHTDAPSAVAAPVAAPPVAPATPSAPRAEGPYGGPPAGGREAGGFQERQNGRRGRRNRGRGRREPGAGRSSFAAPSI